MATLVFTNVVVHNFFDGDIAWTTEFSELLMVWVTFLGGAAATRRGSHMVINELVNHLDGARKRYAEAAIQVVVFVTLGLLAWYGVGIAEAGNFSTLTVLGWPMSTQYIALPVASVITMILVAWDFSEILRGKSTEERHGEGAPHRRGVALGPLDPGLAARFDLRLHPAHRQAEVPRGAAPPGGLHAGCAAEHVDT